MTFLGEIGASVISERVGSVLSRTSAAAGRLVRSKRRRAFERVTQTEEALKRAVNTLHHVTDLVRHCAAPPEIYDPRKVLIAAHTRRLFKRAMVTVVRIAPE